MVSWVSTGIWVILVSMENLKSRIPTIFLKFLILNLHLDENTSQELHFTIKCHDVMFFRIAREYKNEYVDIMILNNDIVLIKADELLPYSPSKGKEWKQKKFLKRLI